MARYDPENPEEVIAGKAELRELFVDDLHATIGLRVVRGERWPFGDQDGGVVETKDGTDGRKKGTVLGFRNRDGVSTGDAPEMNQFAKVRWDWDGSVHLYRVGANGFCPLELCEDQTPAVGGGDGADAAEHEEGEEAEAEAEGKE